MRTLGLLIVLAMASVAPAATAGELVMFRRAGCPWCQAWDREVAYAKTALGRELPLRMAGLDGESPDIVLKAPVRYSPTFVLVEDGREIARIEGYPGADFFWGLLENAARRLRAPPDSLAAAIAAPRCCEAGP